MVKIIKLKETYDDEGHDLGHPNGRDKKTNLFQSYILYFYM
jgi:hypothetical protein